MLGRNQTEERQCELGNFFGWPCRGKLESHHPISDENFHIPLCEAHHSLLQGREKRYKEELKVKPWLYQMRELAWEYVAWRVQESGLDPLKIDKA